MTLPYASLRTDTLRNVFVRHYARPLRAVCACFCRYIPHEHTRAHLLAPLTPSPLLKSEGARCVAVQYDLEMFMRAVASLLFVQLILEIQAEPTGHQQVQLQLDFGVKGSAKGSLPDQLLFYCDDESLTVRFFPGQLSDLYLLIGKRTFKVIGG
ncbi:hypothetical protein SRHO_G00103020 [Serrasalmus rhombeus]